MSKLVVVVDTRYYYTYNGRVIGSRMWSIECCHFQRPWTKNDPGPRFQGHAIIWRWIM